MSAGLLDDLLVDYLAPAGNARALTTPAIPANPAKSEHPCGPATLSNACEGLRESANVAERTETYVRAREADSQMRAAVRRPQTTPRSEETCGSSQDSQLSQGWPPTCAAVEVVDQDARAGAADSERSHARARARADSERLPACGREADPERSQAHARELAPVAWTDEDIAKFLARRARLMRWGWSEPEAEKLADRLVRRDREGDDRVSCTDCRYYRPGRCGNREAAGLHSQEVGRDLAALLQRCDGFTGTQTP